MTKDFKQTATTSSSNQYGISWVLGGIAVGLLVGAVIYATASPKNTVAVANAAATHTAQSPAVTTTPTAVSASTASSSLADKPRAADSRPDFSYHAVLPQLELNVPISAPPEPAQPKAKPAVAEATTPKPTAAVAKAEITPAAAATGQLMLQLGSYKTETQALQVQKRAKQQGLNTRVESAKINGALWYRVRLGPTNDPQIVERWKQRLSGMGISPMVIRL